MSVCPLESSRRAFGVEKVDAAKLVPGPSIDAVLGGRIRKAEDSFVNLQLTELLDGLCVENEHCCTLRAACDAPTMITVNYS